MKFRKYDSTNLLAMMHWRSSMSDLMQAKPRTLNRSPFLGAKRLSKSRAVA